MTETDPTECEARPASLARALALTLVLAVLYVPFVDDSVAWGWDESMHAELPAVHMLLAAADGDVAGAVGVAAGCHQYPFVFPTLLAAVQGVFGISEAVGRATGRALWVLLAFGAFGLVREVGRRRARPSPGDDLAPWLAFALVVASPLVLTFSGTLFLEVPAATGIVWTLWAWLRRQRPGAGLGASVLAGSGAAAVFFTKFHYGGLLVVGLAIAFAVEALERLRAGERGRVARDAAALAVVPLAAGLWWFVWPWPLGADAAATHRRTIVDLLAANRQLDAPGWGYRWLHWTAYLCWSPRVFLLGALGVLASLCELGQRAGRALWIVALALVVPIVAHEFYLWRLLIPPGVLVFVLAALGLARVLPAGRRARAVALAVLVPSVALYPSIDAVALAARLPRDLDTVVRSSGARFRASDPAEGGAPSLTLPADPFRDPPWPWLDEVVIDGARAAQNDGPKRVARFGPAGCVLDPERSAFVDEEPGALVTVRPKPVLQHFDGPERDYVLAVIDGYSNLAPWRPLETSGLARPAYDRFLDLLAGALGPRERLGWIGISSELSPAAIHVGLLERAADREAARARFRSDATGQQGGMMIAFANRDPEWSERELRAFAAQFDAIAYTDPIDIKARAARMAFMPGYRDRLLALGWQATELGTVAVEIPLKEPIDVRLFLARPPVDGPRAVDGGEDER